jgi:hypothetical protein
MAATRALAQLTQDDQLKPNSQWSTNGENGAECKAERIPSAPAFATFSINLRVTAIQSGRGSPLARLTVQKKQAR